jgi:hypothetical protein
MLVLLLLLEMESKRELHIFLIPSCQYIFCLVGALVRTCFKAALQVDETASDVNKGNEPLGNVIVFFVFNYLHRQYI